ncbi:MAG TPA: hypothetical protein PKA00_14490 [Saprospiraceae bacterium]|nr:hypothetical protein [Saprospiraceae bacterium]HMQ84118.1 hypothetical protein [Saprospiraceae bacterium]
MDIQATKLELIKIIADIESEKLLEKVKALLYPTQNGSTLPPAGEVQDNEPEWIRLAREPMPEHLDLEALAKDQGYSTEKLFASLRSLDRSVFEDESLEDMLNTLTK